MNSEIKARWLEALRSGRYKQGMHHLYLRKEDGTEEFCCLGVLCDLLNIPFEEELIYKGVIRFYGEDKESGVLPDEAWKAAGFEPPYALRRVPSVKCADVADLLYKRVISPMSDNISLSALNDNGASFEDIADVIERLL